jgi:hypothetical protein
MMFVAMALIDSGTALSATLEQPTILSIRLEGNEVVVEVQVPAGLTKVTLESRAQLGAGNWAPSAVKRLDGAGGKLIFRLPRSANLELLRVRADVKEALPSFFYQGTNDFLGAPGSSSAPPPSLNETAGGARDVTAPGAAESKSSREVVESDIWKLSGERLYFFNQYRGLQVIDVSKPAAPVVLGTLNLPAAGEQMYLLENNYVVLLARDNCYWWGSYGTESQVLVVNVADGTPKVAASLAVPGYIQESRMVGTALYVASGTYQPVANSKTGDWEWGTQVASFDLSNPANPVAKGTLWYSGYGNVVTATDEYLFVAATDTSNWIQSRIRCIDISAPDGSMVARGTIIPAGQVKDKFKMHLSEDVFTVISETWSETRRWVTALETFSLANPAAPQKLGRLELAAGEQLHATRFDGDRVYVVTFFRIDPLWVVDLRDPAKPKIVGELQVPGWSTYIQPLGDRLVAVGIDNSNSWRVAVSLFDVADPAKPTLVSKAPLGENYSWSEANNDEKAFNVMADAGLILLPYQGYVTNGYASRVQLIDLNLTDPTTNALKLRGTIEHEFQPRRATLYRDHILSISGKELLSVAAADRDHPEVLSQTELAWQVSRVFVQGEYLIEIENGNFYGGWWDWNGPAQPNPILRVALADDPAIVLNKITLATNLAILGATLNSSQLYLVQGKSYYVGAVPLLKTDGTTATTTITNPPSLFLSVFDLSKLPALTLSGQQEVVFNESDSTYWNSLQAVWPKPGLLVWSGGSGGGYWWGWWEVGLADVGVARIGAPGLWRPWYWGGNGGRLLAFDVADSTAPKLVSDVNLTTNQWWSFSSAYAADGQVFVSHQQSEFIEGLLPPGQSPPLPTVTFDKETGTYITNTPVIGTWVQRYFLDVVDYTDPKEPTIRKPVSIPGVLQGLSHNGAVLYTTGQHWTPDLTTDWSQEWLDACAYDGVNAALIDSLALPKDWPHPVLVQGPSVFVGRPSNTDAKLDSVETWILSDTGKFTRLGAVFQSTQASALAGLGKLLVIQNNDYTYKLYDATDSAKLSLIGSGRVGGCVWADLNTIDGSLNRGIWIPLGDYGVAKISLTPP